MSSIQIIKLNKFILLILLIGIGFSLSAQVPKKDELEAKRKQLLEEIQYTQKLLEKTKENKKASMADLNALNEQIKLRQKLIGNIQSQIGSFNEQITDNLKALQDKQDELKQLKQEYAEAIVLTYKQNRFANKLLFLASSQSFAEALRRLNYLRRYADYRKQQADIIIQTQELINSTITNIDEKKKAKEIMLQSQVQEKKQLTQTKVVKDKVVKSLKQEEKTLQATITKKQQEASKLNAQIEAIIKKEIEDAKKEAAKNNTTTITETTNKKGTTTKTITQTPEYLQLTSSFLGNKGKLPWPVEKGFISNGWGKQEHPDLQGVIIDNKGIDIRTDPNSAVRVVFEGKVIGIINNPTFKNAVIINHGEYFTVYSKLTSVSVSKGQKVTTKQVIGTAYTDDDNITEVHFEVWKGSDNLNPAGWIYKK